MKKREILHNCAYVVGSTLFSLFCIGANNVRQAQKIGKEEFADKYVYINKQKVPLQEFYENVFYEKGYWIYKDRNGQNRKIDYISDFVHKKNKIACKKWQKRQKHRYNKIDTIYYQTTSGDGFKTKEGNVVFGTKELKAQTLPTIGFSFPNGVCIRQFEPVKGQKRLASIEQFNDNLNKTEVHEDAHNQHENPGDDLDYPTSMRQLGQSHALTFSECCWTEIFANIEQLLAQHEDYLAHGRDLKQITSRFKFYRKALETGKIRSVPYSEFSQQEIKRIADGMVSSWMTDKFPLYYNKSVTRTLDLYRVSQANYNATREDKTKHLRVMRDKSVINGLDFFPYLIGYDSYIINQIEEKDRTLFAQDAADRKKRQTHLDELEGIRMEQGYNAYKSKIYQNARVAKINKTKDYIKKHFEYIKRMLPVVER